MLPFFIALIVILNTNVRANINGCTATSKITCTGTSDQSNSACQYFIREFHNIQKPPGIVCNAASKTDEQNGLTEINGAYYYIHMNQNDKKNWHEANDFCKSRGMDLVTIATNEKNNALAQKLITFTDVSHDHNGRSFWTGLNDLGNEGVFRWISNGNIANYFNWLANEPSNDEKGSPENCVEFINIAGTMIWNDKPCYTKLRFVCEA